MLSNILWAGFFAAVVAVGVTVAIERLGGIVGGALATLPTTIVPAAIGIAAQAPDALAFRRAMWVMPAAMCVNAGFLYLWRILPPRLGPWRLGVRLGVMIVASLGSWALAATLLLWALARADTAHIPLVWVGLASALFIVGFGVVACLKPRAAPRGQRRVGPFTLAARGVLAGVAVGGSVWVAHLGLGLLSGVLAVFPAIFLTTMVSLWLAQGEAVPAGAIGPMMLGSTAVALFALLSAWTIPALGPGLGATTAWLGATLGATVPATWWLLGRSPAPKVAAACEE
jgi:hypothetical protein